jgi:hypothetical protein
MAVALESAIGVICRLVFGSAAAVVVVGGVALTMVGAWMVLPLVAGRERTLE